MTLADLIKDADLIPSAMDYLYTNAVRTYYNALDLTHSHTLAMSYARDEMYFGDGYNLLMVDYGVNDDDRCL